MNLDTAEYGSLATLKRDGSWVATPVWFAPANGLYYVFSDPNAGKVKRLRNFRQIRLAPCTVSGKPLGDAMEGEGWLIDSKDDIELAYRALLAKYGWKLRITDIASKLTGKYHKRQLIALRVPASATR